MIRTLSGSRSLSAQLIVAVSIVIAVVAAVHACAAYVVARSETDSLLDTRLRDVAIRLAAGMADIIMPLPDPGPHRPEDLEIQVWTGSQAQPSRATDPSIRFRGDSPAGFSDQIVNGEAWRIFTVRDTDRIVEVGQRVRVRTRIAEKSAAFSLWPTAVLTPFIWLSMILVVRRTMRQLGTLARQVKAIDLDRPSPLSSQGVAADLLPFVTSINAVFERLSNVRESEKKFISDAAHELRSPITALQLQADNLRNSISPANVERFEELRSGILRGGKLVAQLLQLARADAQVSESESAEINLRDVVNDVIGGLLPIAAARRIDLGVEKIDDVSLHAALTDLRTVIKNLIDNAIRYSPAGGTVDVRVTRQGAGVAIEVIDQGPGIAPEMLTRVFERFVRVASAEIEGTGLGLAIVRAIMQKYEGTATLANRSDGHTGLIANVTFPLAGSLPASRRTAERPAESQH
jgi:two-component system, OmpR family, sensor kinase